MRKLTWEERNSYEWPDDFQEVCRELEKVIQSLATTAKVVEK